MKREDQQPLPRPLSKYPKRGPVIMPVTPPRDVLMAMAGDPVILAARDEQWAVFLYAAIREALAKRKRKHG